MLGIYKIVNLLNGKIYVGSSKNVERRLYSHHRHLLRHNKHWNPHLQAAWNKDGESAFSFELLEEIRQINRLTKREQHWMDTLRVCDRDFGYNIAPKADRSEWSDEMRRKASESRKGKAPLPAGWHHTREARRRISEAQLGKSMPEFSKEHRQKLGARTKGKTYEELYGKKKADEMRRDKRKKMRLYHERRRSERNP